jgi:probable HAF family extracellular repeat protein
MVKKVRPSGLRSIVPLANQFAVILLAVLLVARAATAFVIEDLGTLGGTMSRALAVNASGQVVGASTTVDGDTHAFSWTRAGGMVDLGTLGGTMSRALAVNASGQVVGTSTTADGATHAVLWSSRSTDSPQPTDTPRPTNDYCISNVLRDYASLWEVSYAPAGEPG